MCDTSLGPNRLYVPVDMRRPVFDAIHKMSHPGIKATQKLMAKQIFLAEFKQRCPFLGSCMHSITCQQCKIMRHTKSPTANFPIPSSKFSHLHIVLLGPLPKSNGFSYLLSIVDRITRRPEVYPIKDITADTVADAFVREFVSCFGVPDFVTTD